MGLSPSLKTARQHPSQPARPPASQPAAWPGRPARQRAVRQATHSGSSGFSAPAAMACFVRNILRAIKRR